MLFYRFVNLSFVYLRACGLYPKIFMYIHTYPLPQATVSLTLNDYIVHDETK